MNDLTTKEVKASIDAYFTNYFANTSDLITDQDMDNIKTALIGGDLTIRDYFMGMVLDYPDKTIEDVLEAIALLATYLPEGNRQSLYTVCSAYAYRGGDKDKANRFLELAFTDQPDYPLAKLLLRVYAADWSVDMFFQMAIDVHPKILETIDEDDLVHIG
jgi:hypothetical protein